MIAPITKFILASATVVTLAACDSKQENAREAAAEKKADQMEDKADAVRKNSEQKADAMESQKSSSNTGATNSQLENKADATRKSGEATADKIEDKADAVRDQTPMASPTP